MTPTPGAGSSTTDLLDVLRHVLSDLRLPARRWEILTAADLYGADPSTVALLQAIPEGRYPRVEDIVAGCRGSLPPREPHPANRFPTTRRPTPDRRTPDGETRDGSSQ